MYNTPQIIEINNEPLTLSRQTQMPLEENKSYVNQNIRQTYVPPYNARFERNRNNTYMTSNSTYNDAKFKTNNPHMTFNSTRNNSYSARNNTYNNSRNNNPSYHNQSHQSHNNSRNNNLSHQPYNNSRNNNSSYHNQSRNNANYNTRNNVRNERYNNINRQQLNLFLNRNVINLSKNKMSNNNNNSWSDIAKFKPLPPETSPTNLVPTQPIDTSLTNLAPTPPANSPSLAPTPVNSPSSTPNNVSRYDQTSTTLSSNYPSKPVQSSTTLSSNYGCKSSTTSSSNYIAKSTKSSTTSSSNYIAKSAKSVAKPAKSSSASPYEKYKYNNVLRYDEKCIYQLQSLVHDKLDESVLKILFTDCVIRRTMNENDEKDEIEKIQHCDFPQLQKKINGLCNKIGDKTYEKISQKFVLILQEHKQIENKLIKDKSVPPNDAKIKENATNMHENAVTYHTTDTNHTNHTNNEDNIYTQLLEYIVNTIIKTAMNLLIVLDKNAKNKYMQLKCYAYVIKKITNKSNKHIVSDIFDNILNMMKQKSTNIKSNNNDLETYLKNKNSFINLFVLFAALFEIKFVKQAYIEEHINYLYSQILCSSIESNDTYIPALSALYNNIHCNKPVLTINQLNLLLNEAKYSNKCKFEIMDLKDLIKKNNNNSNE